MTAGLRTLIRAHHILDWAEICSPVHSSFNKACLLFAVVLVHPPAQLLLMSLCQLSGGLSKEMLMKDLTSSPVFCLSKNLICRPDSCVFNVFFLPYADSCVSTCCSNLMRFVLNLYCVTVSYTEDESRPRQSSSSEAFLLDLHHFADETIQNSTDPPPNNLRL